MNGSKLKLTTLIFIMLAVFLSFLSYRYLTNRVRRESAILNVAALSVATPTPAEIFLPVSVDSPDGSRTLVMKLQKNNTVAAYSFFASEKSRDREKLIAAKTVSPSRSFSIPDNTWSPDNKYAFIKESSPVTDSYFVLPASDSLPQTDLLNTDIQALFSQKYPQYNLTEITGWADPYLLILNTTGAGGERGPSFWFDITSLTFIQLDTRF